MTPRPPRAPHSRHPPHPPGSSRLGLWLCYAVAFAAAGLALIPFVWLVCASLKSPADFFTSAFLPLGEGWLGIAWDRLTLDNYRTLFSDSSIARGLLNSVLISSVTALLATLACAMGGYALARLEFAGRRAVSWLVMAALIIPPPLLVAPGFEVLYRLGLLDTFMGLILPAIGPAFGVFLFRQATLSSVPKEVLEAAKMDSCGEVSAFFRIVLPLVQPMVAAFLMITFLAAWNNFLSPQIVMQTPGRFPLSVMIAQLKNVYYQDYGLLMAGTLVSIAPVAGLFLLLQKDFVAGLTSGALKG